MLSPRLWMSVRGIWQQVVTMSLVVLCKPGFGGASAGVYPRPGRPIIIGLLDEGDMNNKLATIRAVEVSHRWIQEKMPDVADPGSVKLLICTDDSMHDTISLGDVVLLDTSVREVSNDGIYAFSMRGEFFLKRLQRLPDGGLLVISDNKDKYPAHKVSAAERSAMKVKGRALYTWAGRKL